MKKYLTFLTILISLNSEAGIICEKDTNKVVIEIPSQNDFNYNLVIQDKRKIKTKSYLAVNEPNAVAYLSYCSEKNGVCLPATGKILFTNDGETLVGNISVTAVPGHPEATGLKSFVETLKIGSNLLCS